MRIRFASCALGRNMLFVGAVVLALISAGAPWAAAAEKNDGPSEAKSQAAVAALDAALAKGDVWGDMLAARDFAQFRSPRPMRRKPRTCSGSSTWPGSPKIAPPR